MYAKMAANNSRKSPEPTKGPHPAGDSQQLYAAQVKVCGTWKILGALRETTVRSLKEVILKLSKIKCGFKVKGKDQTGNYFHEPSNGGLSFTQMSWSLIQVGVWFRATLPGSFSSLHANLLVRCPSNSVS